MIFVGVALVPEAAFAVDRKCSVDGRIALDVRAMELGENLTEGSESLSANALEKFMPHVLNVDLQDVNHV